VPPRNVRPLPEAQLVTLSTQRLMAYRKRLLELEDSAALSDWDDAVLKGLDPTLIWFKEDPSWSSLYVLVTQILSQREHA
jgi:hypothetical protein